MALHNRPGRFPDDPPRYQGPVDLMGRSLPVPVIDDPADPLPGTYPPPRPDRPKPWRPGPQCSSSPQTAPERSSGRTSS